MVIVAAGRGEGMRGWLSTIICERAGLRPRPLFFLDAHVRGKCEDKLLDIHGKRTLCRAVDEEDAVVYVQI